MTTSRRKESEERRIELDVAFLAIVSPMALASWVRVHGLEWFVKIHRNKMVVDESERAGKLWYVFQRHLGGMYFLEYVCPSTGKKYVSGVDREVVSPFIVWGNNGKLSSSLGMKGLLAECAMAWKLGLEITEYLKISAES